MKFKWMTLGLAVALSLWLIACGGSAEPDTTADETTDTAVEEAAPEVEIVEVEEMDADEISGTITVLTNRTDIVDTVFVEYAARFNEIYPNVTVEFEALTDYPGEVKIRMNTTDYGDVLLIPNEITPDQFADFFSPLGTVEELDAKYNFVTEKAFDGLVYGLPVVGNAQGIVYNKAVFEAAGVTELPTSPEAFLDAMQLIKDNTDAVPYYTNYAAGWPLVQWEGNRGSLSCNPNYSNELAYTDAPFAEGSDHYVMYKLMYDLVANGLVEEDPSTTDWETSKELLGTGQIGAMVLGSWSIVQMQDAADNPADIGYMPFPAALTGEVCSSAGGDWKMGINVNSPNQEAARAWVDWFLDESGFAGDQGGIPPVKGQPFPDTLAAFEELNVQLISQEPSPAGEEGWVDNIDAEAEIGLWAPAFRQRIVDAARGNTSESIDDIFADLNSRWAEARAEVVGEASAPEPAEMMGDDSIEGTITVLTNRTDIVDTVFVEYAAEFNELYPNVTVEFEALTDYPGEVKIRMNTTDYGDVLLIPNEITPDQFADFFSPLGTVEELDPTYNFVTEKAFDGVVYGLPVVGNAQGIVYNKAVFEAAGVTELPTSPEGFIEAMQLIKDNTDAVPYYTNYAAGWPLVQWEGNRGALSCNPNYSNELAYTDTPFVEGSDHYVMYKLMYDLVANGLVEEDPSTTDWETSKELLGTGQIGAMVLGSWSIVQMQEAADNPEDIGYMPFPAAMTGEVCSSAGGDWKMGINVNSPNQEAAEAWVFWFLNESGFAADQGGIPPVKGQPFPDTLASFEELDVQLISQEPSPAGEEGWVDNIDAEAEIGLWSPGFRQRIVDAARGNSSETIDDIFADLNARWAEARAEVITE